MKAAILLVSCLAFATQATPPRDTSARPAGTGVVRGRVTSAAGEPLHRVRITLTSPNPNPPTAVTDTRGEYEIRDVPAGSYTLTASRAGYLTIQYGQRRTGEVGRTLEVSAGEMLERIDLALPRGGVLAGAVTDEAGEQYQGVRVEAVEFRYMRGRRVPVQAAATTTNDLGQFRLSALPPGIYLLRASATDTWDSDDGASTFAYVTTYFPGVTGSDEAQTISLATGQEIGNLTFSLRPGRTARITGVVQNAAGEPMPAQSVNLSGTVRGVGGALFATGGPTSRSGRSDANGIFDFRNLVPGEYVLSSGTEAERSTASLIVGDGDVRSVVLTPRRPSALSGTIVSDDGTPLTFVPTALRVQPIAADPELVLPSFTAPAATTVTREWTFRFANFEGSHLFRLTGLPSDWMLSAVLLNGRTITDTAVDIPSGGAETKGLQLVVSRNGARVTGQVLDQNGAPAADSTVIIFAADRAQWMLASRFIRAVRPDNAGRFSAGGLPPGSYRAAARDFVADGQWEDPNFLNSLLPTAVPFALTAGESQTVALKLEPQQ